jgi:hypothetical protein
MGKLENLRRLEMDPVSSRNGGRAEGAQKVAAALHRAVQVDNQVQAEAVETIPPVQTAAKAASKKKCTVPEVSHRRVSVSNVSQNRGDRHAGHPHARIKAPN